MPKLPDSNPMLSLDIPSVNMPSSSEFGKIGNAIEYAAEQVEGAGFDALTQIKHAEAQDASSSAFYKDKVDSENKITQLKLQSSDGYMHEDPTDSSSDIIQNQDGSRRTMSQEFYDWANERYQNTQTKMPTELAYEMYKSRALPYLSDQQALVQNDTQVMKVKAYDQRKEADIKSLGDQLVSNPNLLNFYLHANDVAPDFKSQIGVMHNAAEADQKTRQAYQSLSRDLMQGAYTQILSQKKEGDPTRLQDIQRWRDVLSGNDPMSRARAARGMPVLADMMDPIQKSVEEEKLVRLIPTAQAADLNDFRAMLHQTMTAQEMGQGDPSSLNYLLNQTAQYAQSKDLHPVEAAQIWGDLFSAKAIGRMQGPSFDALPLDQKTALIEQASKQAKSEAQTFAQRMGVQHSGDMGATSSKQIDDRLIKQALSVESEKRQDFASFSQRVLPSGQMASKLDYSSPISIAVGPNPRILQQSLHDSLALSKTTISSNPDYWRPVTKEQSSQMSNFIKNPNISDEQAGQAIKAMSSAYGRWFPGVMDQMIQDGLPEGWRVAALNPSSSNTTFMVSSIRGNQAIDTAFKAKLEALGEKESDFDGAAYRATQTWTAAKIQESPLNLSQTNFVNSVNLAVKNGAKQIWLNDPSMSADEAVKRSSDRLINNYAYTNTMGGGWFSGPSRQSLVTIPKNVNGTPISEGQNSIIMENLRGALTEEGISRLHPFVPPKANGQPSDFADEFIPQIARTGRASFVQSPEPGFNIWYQGTKDKIEKQLYTTDLKGRQVPAFIPLQAVMQPKSGGGIMEQLKKYLPSYNTPVGHQ